MPTEDNKTPEEPQTVVAAPSAPEPKFHKLQPDEDPAQVDKAYGVPADQPSKMIGGMIKIDNPLAFVSSALDPMTYVYAAGHMVYEGAKVASRMTKQMMTQGDVSIPDLLQTSASVAGGGVTASLSSREAASLGMFAGKRSKMWRTGPVHEAEKMAREGKTADEIWDTHTLEKDEYGDWRTEVQGNKAKLDLSKFYEPHNVFPKEHQLSLGDVWDFPELYQHYPEAKHIGVKFGDIGRSDGQYDPSNKTITLSRRVFGDMVSAYKNAQIGFGNNQKMIAQNIQTGINTTLKHEVQHWISDIEGWAPGANSSTAAGQALNKLEQLQIQRIGKFYDDYQNAVGKEFPTNLHQIIDQYHNGLVDPESYAGKIMHYMRQNHPQLTKELLDNKRVISEMKGYKDTRDTYPGGRNHLGYEMYRHQYGEVTSRLVEARDNPRLEGRAYKTRPGKMQGDATGVPEGWSIRLDQ